LKCDNNQKTVKTTLYVAILYAVACGVTQAQVWEIGVNGGYARLTHAVLGSMSPEQPDDHDTTVKGRYTTGASITRNILGYYGVELGYSQTRADARTILRNTVDSELVTTTATGPFKIHRANLNFLAYWMPRGSRWRPYVTAGAQGYQYSLPHIPSFPFGENRKFGGNYGAGIKLVPLKHTLLRLDVRDYFGGKPWFMTFSYAGTTAGLVHQVEGTAGFSITF
jgi:hypothetical protein